MNRRGKRCFFTPAERLGACALVAAFVVLAALSIVGVIGG